MTAIRYTPTAQRQLDEIWAYSMAHWGEARTNRYLMAIEEAIEAVASGRRRAPLRRFMAEAQICPIWIA